MKQLIFIFILNIYCFANVFDDYFLFQAQTRYKENNLKESLKYYKKIENKSDYILYNMGNILYKQKKYKEAITLYKKIDIKKLKYKTLHNLGNSYAKLDNYTEAIKFYEEALDINDNSDTKINLNFMKTLEKIKEEKEKKKKSKIKEKIDIRLRSGQNEIDNIDDKDFKDITEEINGTTQKKELIIDKNNISQLASKNIDEEYNLKDDKNIITKKLYKNSDANFTNLEEKKWDKSLKNRSMNSLIIPLTKGTSDETIKYPW